MALTSWLGPWYRAVSILLAPVVRALGMNVSRGMERMDSRWVLGSRWRIMITSLLIPLTPCEQRPKAGFCCLRAQRSVEPTRRMFSVFLMAPAVGEAPRPFTFTRWISLFRYQR